jgi:hypothetical protein
MSPYDLLCAMEGDARDCQPYRSEVLTLDDT